MKALYSETWYNVKKIMCMYSMDAKMLLFSQRQFINSRWFRKMNLTRSIDVNGSSLKFPQYKKRTEIILIQKWLKAFVLSFNSFS